MTNDAHEGLANATTRDDAVHALALGWNERLATELIEKKIRHDVVAARPKAWSSEQN